MIGRLAGDFHMTFTTEKPGSCSTVARQAAPKARPRRTPRVEHPDDRVTVRRWRAVVEQAGRRSERGVEGGLFIGGVRRDGNGESDGVHMQRVPLSTSQTGVMTSVPGHRTTVSARPSWRDHVPAR